MLTRNKLDVEMEQKAKIKKEQNIFLLKVGNLTRTHQIKNDSAGSW